MVVVVVIVVVVFVKKKLGSKESKSRYFWSKNFGTKTILSPNILGTKKLAQKKSVSFNIWFNIGISIWFNIGFIIGFIIRFNIGVQYLVCSLTDMTLPWSSLSQIMAELGNIFLGMQYLHNILQDAKQRNNLLMWENEGNSGYIIFQIIPY